MCPVLSARPVPLVRCASRAKGDTRLDGVRG